MSAGSKKGRQSCKRAIRQADSQLFISVKLKKASSCQICGSSLCLPGALLILSVYIYRSVLIHRLCWWRLKCKVLSVTFLNRTFQLAPVRASRTGLGCVALLMAASALWIFWAQSTEKSWSKVYCSEIWRWECADLGMVKLDDTVMNDDFMKQNTKVCKKQKSLNVDLKFLLIRIEALRTEGGVRTVIRIRIRVSFISHECIHVQRIWLWF